MVWSSKYSETLSEFKIQDHGNPQRELKVDNLPCALEKTILVQLNENVSNN